MRACVRVCVRVCACVCACVRACVRARERVRVRVRVCVCVSFISDYTRRDTMASVAICLLWLLLFAPTVSCE